MKNIKSNSGNARRLVTGLLIAAMLAVPLAASAAPRHAPPSRHDAPARAEHRHPVPPPRFHEEPRRHMPPPPPRCNEHHRHHDSDAATGVAVAVGTIAAIGLIAAFCAD